MIERDLRGRGIRDERVLAAMGAVPRHLFVRPEDAGRAYADAPLPTRDGQTISQPYIVALMTEALRVTPGLRVLEIGTGAGYQTTVLAALGAAVWSIERSSALSREAGARLKVLGVVRVHLAVGDGTLGWPAAAPFDRILATGGLPSAPAGLLRQLVPGGIFVGPVGTPASQRLVRVTVDPPATREETLCLCAFVPLIGADGWKAPREEE